MIFSPSYRAMKVSNPGLDFRLSCCMFLVRDNEFSISSQTTTYQLFKGGIIPLKYLDYRLVSWYPRYPFIAERQAGSRDYWFSKSWSDSTRESNPGLLIVKRTL